MNILLIEDDAGLVELIRAMLEELGYSVMSAASGAEAMTHLKKQTPDLMLLDYSLPDINGKELIESLNKQQMPIPPFIITTGQGDERIAVNMMKLGAMDYLIKDILFLEKLPDVVKRLIKEIKSEGKLKQVEEALNQSTQLLEASQSIAKLGGWELDIATNNLFWTAETYRIHDTSPEEFNPTVDAGVGYFLPESRRIISDALEAAIEHGEGYDLVLETYTTKGRRIDVRTTCVVTLIDGKTTKLTGIFQDITERKKADDELIKAQEKVEESEKRLNQSEKISKVGNWEYDLITKNIVWSNQLFEIYERDPKIGPPSDDEVGKYYSEEDHKRLRQYIVNIIESGDSVENFECPVNLPSGKTIICSSSMFPVKDGNGTIVKIFGSLQDITERKLAEQEIVKTKQFYENIIEGVQDGIWVTDKNDIIYYANSAIEKIAGVPREQIQGNNVLTDFPKETTGELIKFYNQAKKEKKPIWYDIKVRTLANIDTWQNGWLIPQYLDNAFSGIICTIRDITERKKAESSVRRLSTAVQQSPSIIVISDTEGKLEYVNPKFTELTGYSSSEAIGKESNILKSGEQDPAFYKELWDTVESGNVWRGQFHNKKKNGELFWEAASISAILNESGDVINFIKIGEDITQQKNTEIQLKAALEKAMESDRLKSAFLANMSHEIRTPMNGILGFINLLNEPNLSKAQIDKYTAIINKSSDRLLNTINDIIDISKIEAGEIVVSNTETSINDTMDELYSFHSPEAKQKGLSFVLETSDEKLRLNTDSHKLHGILTNLIKNAIKYTEKGHITFGYSLKEKCIEFHVKDTGIGIPKGRIHAIFNRFEQADIGDTKVFEGSGLGLAISKAYVEMLGGKISVESDEGKGSTFTFTLPYTKKIKKEIKRNSESINDNNGRIENLNLLIVEDDDVSSQLIETMLKGMFKKIIYAKNGIEAIELCKNKPEIDLVLMDLKMPKMNGFEATRAIRKFNKDLLIIAQTAYAMFGDKEKALEAGCNDYISKPINKKLLLELINKSI